MAAPGQKVLRITAAAPGRNGYRCLQCASHLSNSQNRFFSSSASRRKAIAQTAMPSSNIMQHIPKQKSSKMRMKDIPRGELPTDLGLIPQTYIPPPSDELPSWISSEWNRRARIALLRIRTAGTNFFTLFYFLKWQSRKNPLTGKAEKNPPLQLSLRLKIARDLHQKFYTSVAAGDMNTLQKLACSGLLNKMKIRIDYRKASNLPAEKWKMMKYNGVVYPDWLRWPLLQILPFSATRVVSDKVSPLPIGKDSYMRQVIVRIRTTQLLDKSNGKPARMWRGTEYIVLQKTRIGDTEKDWMVWGTLEPSSKEDIAKLLDGSRTEDNLGFMDRIRQTASQYMGV